MIRLYLAAPPLLLWFAWTMHAIAQRTSEPIPAPREAKPAPSLVGHYAVEGTGRTGKPYLGTVLIAEAGGNYSLTWLLEDGAIYRGIGFREGETLIVGAVTEDSVSAFKFVVGTKDGKPQLIGRWAQGGSQGAETLTLVRRPSL